jgi:hypothetical protein
MKENLKAIIILIIALLGIFFLYMTIHTDKWIYISFGIICFGIVKIVGDIE